MKKPQVLLVTPAQAAKVRAFLAQHGATFGQPPHTRFDASVDGARITCYTSGKLLLQGAAAAAWIEKLGPLVDRPAQDDPDDHAELAIATIGSDESGKGDYFGSLVVAACMLTPKDVRMVRELGVRDSKDATDPVIRAAALQLEATVACAIDELTPEAYNARHAEVGNVNIMLGEAHARVICDLAKRTGARDVVVDRFGGEHYVRDKLGDLARELRITMVPRAESNPAVAAASFLARARFVQSLERLSEEIGVTLVPGASSFVERRARELVARCGVRTLQKVAKMHFKTTSKVVQTPFDDH